MWIDDVAINPMASICFVLEEVTYRAMSRQQIIGNVSSNNNKPRLHSKEPEMG